MKYIIYKLSELYRARDSITKSLEGENISTQLVINGVYQFHMNAEEVKMICDLKISKIDGEIQLLEQELKSGC